jgi:hypothetical protein
VSVDRRSEDAHVAAAADPADETTRAAIFVAAGRDRAATP